MTLEHIDIMKPVQIKLKSKGETEVVESASASASKTVKNSRSEAKEGLRTRGREILNRKLGSLLDPESLDMLEEGIVDEESTGRATYDQILGKVCLHLNPNSSVKNTYLLEQVKSGQIDIRDVASMSPIDMHPQAWAKQSIAIQLETEQVAGGVKKAVTGIIKCKKCGSKTSYNEVQTRSCDEAATVTVHCPKCNTKWTQ
jgi:DNA-directed RNA polymerase subunit M/transcription elongation factor TFIIS